MPPWECCRMVSYCASLPIPTFNDITLVVRTPWWENLVASTTTSPPLSSGQPVVVSTPLGVTLSKEGNSQAWEMLVSF